jgi:hypothetical protein
MFASIGLALDRNWFKLARVAAAFSCYTVGLVALSRWRGGHVSWGSAAAAGALAGVASGLVRPETTAGLVAVQACGGALLGSVHWLGLMLRARLRSPLTT